MTKKFIIIFIVVLVQYFKIINAAVIMEEPILSAVEICRRETGATEADFELLLKKSKPINMAAKCMRACLMKKFNLMDADGKFNRDVALHIAQDYTANDPERLLIATEIVNACYSMPVSDNHCEAAEQYGACAIKEVKARGIRQKREAEWVALIT